MVRDEILHSGREMLTRKLTTGADGRQLGNPVKLADIMADLIRGEGVAKNKEIPKVLQVGSDAVTEVRAICEGTLETMKEWNDVILSTDNHDY